MLFFSPVFLMKAEFHRSLHLKVFSRSFFNYRLHTSPLFKDLSLSSGISHYGNFAFLSNKSTLQKRYIERGISHTDLDGVSSIVSEGNLYKKLTPSIISRDHIF